MDEIKVSFDKFRYSSKPNSFDVSTISDRIAANIFSANQNNIKSFIDLVSKDGCTFCPATFRNGTRRRDNFEQMQLLVLDFDGGISLSAVFERAEKYNLPILFAYDTFSSTEHDRFRIIFLNDISITDIRAVIIAQNALVTIFPESDKSCKDISRMYFGGKELLYFDEDMPEITIESLIRNMSLYLKDKYGDTHYKNYIKKFAKGNDIALNRNNMLDISIVENVTEQVGTSQFGKNSPSTIIVYKVFGDNSPNLYYIINTNSNNHSNNSVDKKILKIHGQFRSGVMKDIHRNCKLFKEFETNSRRLTYRELYGIATNLVQIESGVEKFINYLKINHNYNNVSEKYKRWNYYLKYFKQNEYSPTSCNLFCPYIDECIHCANILSTAAPKYRKMEKLISNTEPLCSIQEAEKDLELSLLNAINADDYLIHVIKAQVAIGKTETYLKLMKDALGRWLIAVPTNILKHEIYERALAKGLKVIETPSLNELKDKIPANIWNHINNLYKIGKYVSVNPYIKKELMKQDIPCLRDYLKKMKECENFDGHVITTHKKILSTDERTLRQYDTILVDEDILYNTIIPNQCEIIISDLEKIASRTTDYKLAAKIKEALKATKTKSLFKLSSINWSSQEPEIEVEGISMSVDIPSFCLAERFCYREASKEKNLKEDTIVFLKPAKFRNTKYIIVSATVDEKIYNYYFSKKRIHFYNCKKSPLKGTLNQYSEKSMSRTCIAENPDIINQIRKWTGNDSSITFKKFEKGQLHFGNAIGSNSVSGKNLDVIGTPYHPEFLYKLFAYTIGLHFIEDEKMKLNNKATHNGYKFTFTTYDEGVLRDIHFWMIESELEQAIGRARLLRNGCTVNLFSNFPVTQATHKKSDY